MASYLSYDGLCTLVDNNKKYFEASSNKISEITDSSENYPSSLEVKNYVDSEVLTDVVEFTESSVTIEPNKLYIKSGNAVTSLTVTKGTDVSDKLNHYFIQFKAGDECSVTWSGFSLTWYGGNTPTWTSGKTYEVSIINDLALYNEF